jgi:predicted DNA-binding transcriptional regulator AlpA
MVRAVREVTIVDESEAVPEAHDAPVVFDVPAVAPLLRILSWSAVSDRTSLSRSTIRDLVKRRSFPQPVTLTEFRSGFLEAEVSAWIALA